MKSFSILRTNTGLTSNVKVTVDSNYNLYLDSINSCPDLDLNRFKKFQFNKKNFYDELVPYFFKDFPSDLAFEIKYSNDNSNMSSKFSDQYDDIYQMGARNISNNKDYKEEYEFLAPLYIFKHNIPKYFGIFRVDGHGLGKLDRYNFRNDFLKKLKCVKVFDLTKKTNLGEWVDLNFKNNPSFPTHSLEVDFRNLEFSKWIGIDYQSGGFTSKSRFMDDALERENTLYDFEKSFFDGFSTNKIIYPQIVNFNFLFDDNPATKTSLRKWSINRYCGFYFDDMEIIDSITPFVTPVIRSDATILDGNILYSPSGDPFVRGYSKLTDVWVEYLGNFYKVEKFKITNKNSLGKSKKSGSVSIEDITDRYDIGYRIISDINMIGEESLLNKKQFRIDEFNRIVDLNGNAYQIEDFELSDINLIEIDGKFHNLILDDGFITVWSDYGFKIREEYTFEYYINYPDENYLKSIDIRISNSNSPTKFNIYRVNFTEIKDFDTNIVDSNLARYEYEKILDINYTEEPKLYTTDLRFKSIPPPINDYFYKGEVKNIPASSDYTANLETFRIVNGELSELWRKNPVHCRWGYQNSISKSDYPYLLNNNEIHGDFNGVCDTNNFIPDRSSRNLDYFYTFNSGSTEYKFQSLNIERNYGSVQDSSLIFELDKYMNIFYPNLNLSNISGTISSTYSLDYFEEIFGSDVETIDGKVTKNYKKYSYFERGDSSIPNTTLFRGLKFRLFEVDSIDQNQDSIGEVNLSSSNFFEDYKLSILFSQNNQLVDDDHITDSIDWGYFIDNQYQNNGNVAMLTSTSSTPLNIQIGDSIEIRQFYPYINEEYQGFSEVLYVGPLDLGGYGFEIDKIFANSTPKNSGFYRINTKWDIIKIWSTDVEYNQQDLVLYDDILYNVSNTNLIEDPNQNPQVSNDFSLYGGDSPFWNPGITYSTGDWVYRNNEYYVRNSESYSISGDFWRMSVTHSIGDYVNYNNRFYVSVSDDNISKPILNSRNLELSSSDPKWVESSTFNTPISSSTNSSIWDIVEIWNQNIFYFTDDYVVHNEILYKCIIDTIGQDTPGISSNWLRVYSFYPDTNFIYGTQSNPFIRMNDNTYLCSFNKDYTLNSGITIYINKKWKNVLINIYIDDGTTINIDNVVRDLLYNELNSKLSAANFIRQINDLDSKYEYSEYTSYVVIEEDGTFQKYKFGENIEDLPYIILCEPPDSIEINNDTIRYSPIFIDKNIIKPHRYLIDGEIDSINKINYYNDNPVGCEIAKSEESKINNVNYGSSLRNTRVINRHSGPYMPIFYTIDLFESNFSYNNPRYKFNEGLTSFGLMRQRIISKINRKENILKLRNDRSNKSIYPMLDEFGYTFIDFFIFKSTWDYEYHIECQQAKKSTGPISQTPQVQFTQNNSTSS